MIPTTCEPMPEAQTFRHPPMRIVIRLVARVTGTTASQLTGKRQIRQISLPRMIAMWVGVRHLSLTTPQVGRSLNRDHTTVLTGIRKVEKLRWADRTLARRISEICERVDIELAKPPGAHNGQAVNIGIEMLVRSKSIDTSTEEGRASTAKKLSDFAVMQPFKPRWWLVNNERFVAAMRAAHPEREIGASQ